MAITLISRDLIKLCKPVQQRYLKSATIFIQHHVGAFHCDCTILISSCNI